MYKSLTWRQLSYIIFSFSIAQAKHIFPCRTKLTWVNPSAMTSESDYIGFVKDGIQASGHQMGRVTKEVDTLVEHLRDALVDVGKYGKVIHIAHSQGSVITWLAAKRLTPEECRRIEVIR
jgi:hypothetical protein